MSGSSSVQTGAKSTNLGDQSSNTSSTNGADNKSPTIKLVKETEYTDTYEVYYDKEKIVTTVTIAGSEVHQWIEDIKNDYRTKLDTLVVGLDIEWKRISDSSERNEVAVLQLCVGLRCLIFQFIWCDAIPGSLLEFLGDDKFTFVGSGIDGDARKLKVDRGLEIAKAVELGPLAAFKLTNTLQDYRDSRFHGAGLKTLARDVLKKDLPKLRRIKFSNWEKGLLRLDQIEYACLDAYVSFELGKKLRNLADPSHPHQPKKSYKGPPEPPKKVEEEQTKPLVGQKSNGAKTNGTNSKRSSSSNS